MTEPVRQLPVSGAGIRLGLVESSEKLSVWSEISRSTHLSEVQDSGRETRATEGQSEQQALDEVDGQGGTPRVQQSSSPERRERENGIEGALATRGSKRLRRSSTAYEPLDHSISTAFTKNDDNRELNTSDDSNDKSLHSHLTVEVKEEEGEQGPEGGALEEEEEEHCFICLDSFTEANPETSLPCKNHLCRQKPVHAKCIYEWRQTNRKPSPISLPSPTTTLQGPPSPTISPTSLSLGNNLRRSQRLQSNSPGRSPTTRSYPTRTTEATQRSSETTFVSSCPLCRGELSNFTYFPPDAINSSMFKDLNLRRQFLLSPVPPKAGFVRCFIKLNHVGKSGSKKSGASTTNVADGSGTKRDHFVYELYLQAPTTLKYPLGPVPDNLSPKDGDRLLAVANRTRYPKKSLAALKAAATKGHLGGSNASGCISIERLSKADFYTPISQLDLYMTDSNYNKKIVTDNYVASVKSSFSGFKHEVLVPISMSDRSKKDGARIIEYEYEETCCVHFVQNRKSGKTSAAPGPRKIQVCLPKVNYPKELDVKKENQDAVETMSNQGNPADPCITPLEAVRRIPSRLSHALTYKSLNMPLEGVLPGKFTFGRNKEPYWLESIQAYSLDFKGRVTLPSNKNFQLLLDLEKDREQQQLLDLGMENVVPELMKDKLSRKGDNDHEEIALQFGKVGEHNNSEIFSMDFRWPLTPIQAFGICLGACDRNIVG